MGGAVIIAILTVFVILCLGLYTLWKGRDLGRGSQRRSEWR